ncbi:MAG: cephalosporin hydroxylase family protein [Ruminococcus sp.]|nr:cephalosporin hydroxylase family protein [Ruminococcus sp.]
MKNHGKLYTWDTNGSKLFFLRTVIQDTILRIFQEKSIWEMWCPVATISTSEYAGITVLNEIQEIAENGVSACFLDSEHTIDNLLAETKQVLSLMRSGSVIIIDDSNYRSKYVNMAYANMLRRKIGLLPCEEPEDNISEKTFGDSVGEYLSENVTEVIHIEDTYKMYYKNDLFWAYYKNDRDIMADMDMEKYDNLEHRFDAWKIIRK